MAKGKPAVPRPSTASSRPASSGVPRAHDSGVGSLPAVAASRTTTELEAVVSDLTGALRSTGVAALWLDERLCLRRFFPGASRAFALHSSDLGRPLEEFATRISGSPLSAHLTSLHDAVAPIEEESVDEAGRTHLRRLQPVRTCDGRFDGVVITFADMSERKLLEARHRLILDALGDCAVLVVDAQGWINAWNAGAEHMLGYPASEVIGRHFSLIYPPEDRAAHRPEGELEQARTSGTTSAECWHVRKDGTRFWAVSLLSALPDQAGARGFVKVVHDGSDRRLSEEALKQAKRNAEAASEAKDLFLANVSHELRTPLSALVLWTSLIEDQKVVDPAQLAEALSAIKRSAEEQRQLIEDLVDTSRIVAGKLSLERKGIHLVAVVESGIEVMRALAQEKGVTLDAQLDPAADAVQADGARLKQVVTNLVTNAVKFTPAGGRVTVKLQRFENTVHLSVADTGEGISPEFLPHLFDRFSQDNRVGKRPDKGLGLGLAIAKQIVELHGGSIAVESPGIGRGSTFTVKLPLREITWRTETALVRGDKAQLVGVLAGRHVLLIEDVAATRRALTAVLQEAGATVDPAESAPAAWEALERTRPDIIVSDLGLPTIDGYTLIRQIRAAEEEAKATPVPAVALTAFAGEGIRHKAIAAGFQNCLTKPIEPLRLATTLAALAPAREPA